MASWQQPLRAAQAQRRAAHAVHVRLVSGQLTLEQALAHPALHGVQVAHVIQWLPGWGPVNTARLLAGLDFPISPNRRCGELTLRQCKLLGERVR